MTRLIVWRHGRSEWNATGRFQGQADADLDDTGRAQAAAAAAVLAAVRPDLIVASDLARARDTAGALAEVTGLPVETDDRLRERHYGRWQGLTRAEIEERYPEDFASWLAGAPVTAGGIEPWEDVGKRVRMALEEVAARVPDGTVVVASHGGAARQGVAALLGWPYAVSRSLMPLRNCHWSDLRTGNSGWRLYAHNVGVSGGES